MQDPSVLKFPGSTSYRPEIDGLRAIAVLSVIFYHAGFGLSGGFIGVDIFFVISGFLITSLIAKEMREGQFSLVSFWERRIRRILPAFFVVAAFCLVLGWFFLLPQDYLSLGKSSLAQSFFSSNLYFWRAINYFSGSSESMPLLHTWSLAVEEQYYLGFPIALLFLIRSRLGTDTKVLLILLFFFLGSLVLAVWILPRDTEAAFYLLPTRAWELLTGAIVAFLPRHWAPTRPFLKESVSVLSLAALVIPLFLYSIDTPFPGMAALLPCVGAALFIWANTARSDALRAGLSARVLGSPVPVFFGLISYSLYLWHWPLLAIPKAWTLLPLDLWLRIFLMLAAVGLAILSWKFVETPIRSKKFLVKRKSLFLSALAAFVVIVGLSGVILVGQGLPQRFPAEVTKLYDGLERVGPREMQSVENVVAGKVSPIGTQSDGTKVDMLLWGDSHARTAASGVDLFLKEHNLTGTLIYYSATAPLFGYVPKDSDSLKEKTEAWAEAVTHYVSEKKVAYVLLGAFWSLELRFLTPEKLRELLLKTVARLNEAGAHVWVLLDVPDHKADVPSFLAHSLLTGEPIERFLETPEEYDQRNRIFLELASSNKNPQLSFLMPQKYLLSRDQRSFLVKDSEGRPLYRDSNHLNGATATKVYRKLAEEQLLPVLLNTPATNP